MVIWAGDARNTHKSFFCVKSLLELDIAYNGSFKCYKVFLLKIKKRISEKVQAT